MPRYFFDTFGPLPYRDQIGTVLPSAQAARVEARKTLAEMAKDHIPDWPSGEELILRVRSEQGQIVAEVALKFAIEPPD